MTRFMAPILMCPANYDTAMLALSEQFHIMRERDGQTEEGRSYGHSTRCVCVIPVCRSAWGCDKLGALPSPWHQATVCPLGVVVTKLSLRAPQGLFRGGTLCSTVPYVCDPMGFILQMCMFVYMFQVNVMCAQSHKSQACGTVAATYGQKSYGNLIQGQWQ